MAIVLPPFAMLIGSNCPKALEPMQVINSQGEGPYAKRTRLGWCVVGAVSEEEKPAVTCNGVKVARPIRDPSIGLSAGHRVVLETKIKDNFISDALREMWKTEQNTSILFAHSGNSIFGQQWN